MPKVRETVRFIVYGSGRFPLDMLRYDRAWPATECDANAAQRMEWGGGCRLIAIEGHQVTERRWQSFGWRVMIEDQGIPTWSTLEEMRSMAESTLDAERAKR